MDIVDDYEATGGDDRDGCEGPRHLSQAVGSGRPALGNGWPGSLQGVYDGKLPKFAECSCNALCLIEPARASAAAIKGDRHQYRAVWASDALDDDLGEYAGQRRAAAVFQF